MRHPLQLIIGLLACLALASALPRLFPRTKRMTYIYYGDVKSGTMDPPFASQFAITGRLHITPETRNPNLTNAFCVSFDNVTHGFRNGGIRSDQIMEDTASIPDAAKVFHNPFVVILNEHGEFEGLMISEDEPGWSRNMKRSIASMLQLDLSHMHLETPMKPHGFVTAETTIHGVCTVVCEAHRTLGLDEKHFTVTKMIEPMSCDDFKQHTFNSRKSEGCMVDDEEEMTTASRRVYDIENTGEDLVIKKLAADGVMNFLPWKASSEAHYILVNQTMELESMVPMDSVTLQELNMDKMMLLDHLTFQQSESLYAVHAGVDHTYGRHVVNLEALRTKLIRLLEEAANYINEINLEITSPDVEHGQTMNRILDTMSRMDIPSLEYVFNNIMDGTSPRDATIKTLFLQMMPYVGTYATCLFIRNIIHERKISDPMAIFMLSNLPYNMRNHSESLLNEMEDLMTLSNDTSLNVRKAGILCFASMIHTIYEHNSGLRWREPELVNRYVQHCFDHVKSEPTYEMKMTYLHAMRNIDMGNAHKLVEPIINGGLKLSDRPDHLRLHAMVMNWRKIGRDPSYMNDIYFPILANAELPQVLRLCAYTLLMEQPPRMDRLMNLHLFMMNEKNEHLYNYHYTTMKSLANTANPCMTPLKEMARKMMRLIRARPVSGIMSGVRILDYENTKFGFGESMTIFTAADDHTGMPIASVIDYTSLSRRRPVNDWSIWIRMEGADVYKNIFLNTTMDRLDIPIKEMEAVLLKASRDMPPQKPVHIEFSILKQGRTIFTQYWDEVPTIPVITAVYDLVMGMRLNMQTVMFDERSTMLVSNDLGLPTLLQNKIPRAISARTTYETFETASTLGLKFDTVIQDWRHDHHSMEVYNPFADMWHAISRVSAYDVSLPITMNIAYNKVDKNLKLNMPIGLPLTNRSIAGMRSYATNYVTVTDSEDVTFDRHGGTFNRTVPVMKGSEHRKNTKIFDFDSQDTGLRFSSYQYDCEIATRPYSQCSKSDETLNTAHENVWDNGGILIAMMLRERYLHQLINPEAGTCGHFVRLEPSMMYPTSEIDITLRSSVQMSHEGDVGLFSTGRFRFHVTLDAKALATNRSAQSWDMNADIRMAYGVFHKLQIQMTRTTPGRQDLTICIDGSKVYPEPEVDPLIRNSNKPQEILGKLIVTMGESENGTCAQDGVSIEVSGKAKMSVEQKKAIEHEMLHGMCQKDVENPVYMYAESSIVPRTPACLKEAILRSSMREYTYTVVYNNIPESVMPLLYSIADELRDSIPNCRTYSVARTEPGTMKIFAEYPLGDESMNLAIGTPTHEEKYIGITKMDYGALGSDLENVRFTEDYLDAVRHKTVEFCAIYPEILLNADGGIMPYVVPTEWILLTGDSMEHMFSVFVKRFESQKLGLLMSVSDHTVEVIPSATNPTVTVDGQVIDHVKGVIIRRDSDYALRISWNYNRLVIQSTYTSFDLEWTERSIFLAMDTNLRGKVTGLCGHLDGTHADRMAKVYSFGS